MLEDRSRPAGQGRQPRKEDARRLHPQGRLRHHRRRAQIPGTADPRRSAAAVWAGRDSELCGVAEQAGEEEVGGV